MEISSDRCKNRQELVVYMSNEHKKLIKWVVLKKLIIDNILMKTINNLRKQLIILVIMIMKMNRLVKINNLEILI
jgi:hypothetical protein